MKGIFDQTFYECAALETIDLSACTSVPEMNSDDGNSLTNVTVYVKDDAMKTAFEAHTEWKQAKAIVVKTE